MSDYSEKLLTQLKEADDRLVQTLGTTFPGTTQQVLDEEYMQEVANTFETHFNELPFTYDEWFTESREVLAAKLDASMQHIEDYERVSGAIESIQTLSFSLPQYSPDGLKYIGGLQAQAADLLNRAEAALNQEMTPARYKAAQDLLRECDAINATLDQSDPKQKVTGGQQLRERYAALNKRLESAGKNLTKKLKQWKSQEGNQMRKETLATLKKFDTLVKMYSWKPKSKRNRTEPSKKLGKQFEKFRQEYQTMDARYHDDQSNLNTIENDKESHPEALMKELHNDFEKRAKSHEGNKAEQLASSVLAKGNFKDAVTHFKLLTNLQEKAPNLFNVLTHLKGDLPSNIVVKSKTIKDVRSTLRTLKDLQKTKMFKDLQNDPDGSKLERMPLIAAVAKINPDKIASAQSHPKPEALFEAMQRVEKGCGTVGVPRLDSLLKAEDPLKTADSMVDSMITSDVSPRGPSA